jgi:acetyltransferase-like isoleucine patch superfamily enzyme
MAGGSPRVLSARVVDVTCGEGVTIVEPCNLYGCSLGDGSFVGPFTEIQRGVTIGKRTRIQSHTFICELVTIGDDTFISHGVTFTNDLFQSGAPEREDASKWKKTVIGSNVSIGSGVTLLPVSICDNVVVGAGAVVTKDITEPGVYAGNPARLLRRL